MKTPLPRRHFLRQAACAGMGAAPLINTLLNLRLAGSVAAAAPGVNDYRALVCLFLPGGIDSFNLLVPRGDDLTRPQHDLAAVRPNDHRRHTARRSLRARATTSCK